MTFPDKPFPPTQDCPDCGGLGEIEDFVDRTALTGKHYTESRFYPCETCEGRGEIPTPESFVKAHEGLEREVADMLRTTEWGAEIILDQLSGILVEQG